MSNAPYSITHRTLWMSNQVTIFGYGCIFFDFSFFGDFFHVYSPMFRVNSAALALIVITDNNTAKALPTCAIIVTDILASRKSSP